MADSDIAACPQQGSPVGELEGDGARLQAITAVAEDDARRFETNGSPAWLRQTARVASTFLAMTGWRPGHLNPVWVLGGAASIALAHVLISLGDWRLTLPYFIFTLLFYYGGNTAILSSRIPARLVARLGEERAFRTYETGLGIMFLNQGLGVGCMSTLPEGLISLPRAPLLVAGALLFALGLIVKLWATLVVGADIFYYRDMFVGRALGPICHGGPYRFLRNPMYGLGQVQAYGYALLYCSATGLLAAATGHFLIYVFYLLVERPFVRRIHP